MDVDVTGFTDDESCCTARDVDTGLMAVSREDTFDFLMLAHLVTVRCQKSEYTLLPYEEQCSTQTFGLVL
jgi:hypothetical protein